MIIERPELKLKLESQKGVELCEQSGDKKWTTSRGSGEFFCLMSPYINWSNHLKFRHVRTVSGNFHFFNCIRFGVANYIAIA